MNPRPSTIQRASEISGLLARWFLGGLFVYMGLSKAMAPIGFLKMVHEYHIVSVPFLLNSIAATLPWFEIFCGLLLVAGVAVRGSALVLLAMLVPFTVAILNRALHIYSAGTIAFCAIKFDCGCGNGEVIICHKLIENGLLILLAAWLAFGRHPLLCARFSLFQKTSPPGPLSI